MSVPIEDYALIADCETAACEPLLETVRGVGFCLRRDSEVAGSS